MAKYSVGGTQVISDSGTIDWSLVINKPPAANVTAVFLTFNNCATGGSVSGSVGTSGAVKTINVTVAT